MTNRKRFPVLLVSCSLAMLAVLPLLFLGCGGSPTTGDKKVTTLTPSPKAPTPAEPKPPVTADPKPPVTPDPKPPVTSGALPALKIAYSDWPGWLVLEIAKQKGFFKEAGVDVDLVWFGDYGKSIEAFTAGKLDGIMIDCASSLSAKSSVIIVLTDYSEGNDMIIGKQGVADIKALKGKTVGLEENLVEHLLLMEALRQNGLTEADVTVKKMPTEDTTAALSKGGVEAVGAWYPISGRTLQEVAGSKPLFTSKEAPGLIYDALQVDPDSLAKRREEWKKVVGIWFKCLAFLNDPKTHDEAVKIMAKRIDAKPEDLEKNLKGTHLLDGDGNLKAMLKRNTLDSVYGSLQNADGFFLKRKAYDKPVKVENMVDSSLVKEVLGK